MLETDQYKEHGSFIDGEFKVIESQISGTSAVIELEMQGNIKNPNSDDNYPCKINKNIRVEDSQIIMTLKGKFEKLLGKEILLNEILETLYLGIDLPFFFNGDQEKFQWENEQTKDLNIKLSHLLEHCEFVGHRFKAYDKSYDLNLEYSFIDQSNANNNFLKTYKFPILSYAFTDEGHTHFYQGINIIPRFKLSREFEYKLKIGIF